jgi:hypothetical protein
VEWLLHAAKLENHCSPFKNHVRWNGWQAFDERSGLTGMQNVRGTATGGARP